MKENIAQKGFIVDKDDNSVTRLPFLLYYCITLKYFYFRCDKLFQEII